MRVRAVARPPAKGLIAMRGLLIKDVASGIGWDASHVGAVLNGYHRPSRRFRRDLSQFLGVPESDLFHDEPAEREQVAG